jgi:ubiquitin-conjugating enzyme E2 variant
MSGRAPGYTPLHRRIEKLALVTHAALTILLVSRLAGEAHGAMGALAVAAGALGGWLTADLVSGVVHWLADHYGSVDTPLVGGPFVRTFREHHDDPLAITRHDFIETNGDSAIVTAPYLAAIALLWPSAPGIAPVAFIHAFAVALGLGVVATTQAHKWAHSARPPSLVRVLQRARIILSPRHHDGHHRGAHDSHYCITTGWLDPLLARVDAWGRLERALLRAGVRRSA